MIDYIFLNIPLHNDVTEQPKRHDMLSLPVKCFMFHVILTMLRLAQFFQQG